MTPWLFYLLNCYAFGQGTISFAFIMLGIRALPRQPENRLAILDRLYINARTFCVVMILHFVLKAF